MKRRTKMLRLIFIVISLIGFQFFLSFLSLYSENDCSPVPGGNKCDAKIRSSKFGNVILQQTPVWCWAATLQMIFRWYGKNISQKNIVLQTFGAVVALPADPFVLVNSIKKSYTDDSGNIFQVNSEIWSQDFNIYQLDNYSLINELSAEHPMIVCNSSHMMVLIGVCYFRPQFGPLQLIQAWVADPFLSGQVTPDLPSGYRYLFPYEMIPTMNGGQLRFVAAVSVY